MSRAVAACLASIGFILSPAYGALLAPVLGVNRWAGMIMPPGVWLVVFAGFLAWRLARDIQCRNPLVEGASLWLWWFVIICIAVLGLIAVGTALLLQAMGG